MKKSFFLIAASFIFFLTLTSCCVQKEATTTTLESVNFGLKAGLNRSDITGPDVESFNGLTSFHVGAIADIPINDRFSFQPELQYSEQGSEYDEGEGYGGTTRVNYLNVPLMGIYNLGDCFSLEAGPQVGFLMSAKEEYEFSGESEEYDIDDELKSTDIGLNFGVGYRLQNGLNFGARYNLGLTDINDSDDRDGGATYRNSVFQFSIGYFFQ